MQELLKDSQTCKKWQQLLCMSILSNVVTSWAPHCVWHESNLCSLMCTHVMCYVKNHNALWRLNIISVDVVCESVTKSGWGGQVRFLLLLDVSSVNDLSFLREQNEVKRKCWCSSFLFLPFIWLEQKVERRASKSCSYWLVCSAILRTLYSDWLIHSRVARNIQSHSFKCSSLTSQPDTFTLILLLT